MIFLCFRVDVSVLKTCIWQVLSKPWFYRRSYQDPWNSAESRYIFVQFIGLKSLDLFCNAEFAKLNWMPLRLCKKFEKNVFGIIIIVISNRRRLIIIIRIRNAREKIVQFRKVLKNEFSDFIEASRAKKNQKMSAEFCRISAEFPDNTSNIWYIYVIHRILWNSIKIGK